MRKPEGHFMHWEMFGGWWFLNSHTKKVSLSWICRWAVGHAEDMLHVGTVTNLGRLVLLALEGLCAIPIYPAWHESVVRLADGTTWHNAIAVGRFPQLRKQVPFRFFSAAITHTNVTWGIFDVNSASLVSSTVIDFFISRLFYHHRRWLWYYDTFCVSDDFPLSAQFGFRLLISFPLFPPGCSSVFFCLVFHSGEYYFPGRKSLFQYLPIFALLWKNWNE